jgi:hypothetical protein
VITGEGPESAEPPDGEGVRGPGSAGPPGREGLDASRSAVPSDPEARRRVSLAVHSGLGVADPADARAAVELARLAQRRLETRTLPNALRISAGVVAVWLVLVAVPATISTGVHPAALAAGVGVGFLLFGLILLLGRRQLRLARRAEQRNLALLEGDGPAHAS